MRERGLHADPEGVVHHVVGVGQVAADAVLGSCAYRAGASGCRRTVAGADLVLVEVGQQVQARDRAVVLERDGKAKPGRIGMLGCLGAG